MIEIAAAPVTTPAPSPHRRPWSLPPAAGWLTAWAVLVVAQIVSPLWYHAIDSAGYLSIARSLAAGGQPTNLGSPHLVYAAGYPLLIWPVFLTGPYPFLALSLLHAALAVAYLAGVYVWARRLDPVAAVPVALLSVGQITVLVLFRRALSEPAFMAIGIWLVNLLNASRKPNGRTGRLAAAALLLAALALIRQAGILFAAGFVLWLGLRVWRRELTCGRACLTAAAVGLPAVAALGGMMAYDHEMGRREGSVSNLAILARAQGRPMEMYTDAHGPLAQLAEGVRVRVSEVGRLTVPGMFSSYNHFGSWVNVNMAIYLPLTLVVVFGWCRLVRRQADVFLLTVPLYAALYIYWPWDQAGRYFAPLLPVLFLGLWTGLARWGSARLPLFRTLAVLHLCVAAGFWLVRDLSIAREYESRRPEIHALADHVRQAPGKVQTQDRLDVLMTMLAFDLDRPVHAACENRAVDADTRWLVLTTDADGVDGFAEWAASEHYRLLRRSAPHTFPPSLTAP